MKQTLITRTRLLQVTLLAAACMVAAPTTSLADRDRDRRDRHDDRGDRGRDRDRGNSWRGDRHDRDDDVRRKHFYARPRSSFTLSFGTGYAGRGYYYGPPGMPYYYQAPGVTYYRSRSAVPRRYVVQETYRSSSADVAVQRELARRGYYRGPIDGDIGPGSRSAIAAYQRSRGLSVTGSITPSLLRSLGI